MKNTLFCSVAALALALSGTVLAEPTPGPADKPVAPAAPKPVEKQKAPEAEKPMPAAITCELLTKEAPRGGRLEVQGDKLGKSPVVKIGGVVTRIIERPGDKIAVQIPRKSDGGAVIVRVDGNDVACGTLTIIGLD